VILLSGMFSSEYLATATFVDEVDKLFDSFNSVSCAVRGKELRHPLNDNSPHIRHWTKASMWIRSWVFLKDGKPAFKQPPPSQTGWLIDIAAAQHVWRTLKEAEFECLETRNLNQDPLENTFGAIRLHCGSNNNPTVGQFVDALKTSIINGLAFRGLRGTNCEEDDTSVLDNLHSLLRGPDASPSDPSTRHSRETPDNVGGSLHVAEQIQQAVGAAVRAGDMKMLSVAYVSGFIAKHLLRVVSCEACKACLTSQAMLSTNAFVYFKEYSDTKQSLTYPSEKLVETLGTCITLLENMMAEVAHLSSVEQRVTAAIKKSVDFDWIRSTGCSLHYQGLVDGIVSGVTRISIPWWRKRKNRSVIEAVRQRATKRKINILSHQ
jgi:hypothetical protein